MTAEPNTANTPEDVTENPAPDGAPDLTPSADTDTVAHADPEADPVAHAETDPNPDADTPNAVVRRAAADALEQVVAALDDDTSVASLFAAIKDQADAAGRAHGLKPESWNHHRVEAMATVALYTATLTYGEAADALRERLRQCGPHYISTRLTNAITILRP